MFAKIVKNQYIGKSKIDFTFNGKLMDGKNLIGDIALPLMVNDMPLTMMDTHYPDYFIIGDITDISTMELVPKDDKYSHILFITGIPKSAKRLDDYKLKNIIWSSYYEDNYRGYLFQIVKGDAHIELLYDCTKINIRYGTTRVYTKV